MRIVYIVPEFPNPSQTFIMREVLNLIKQGFAVNVVTFKSNQGALPNEEQDKQLLVSQIYVLTTPELILGGLRALFPSEVNKRLQALQAASGTNFKPLLLLSRAYAIAHLMHTLKADWIEAHWPYSTILADLVHLITGVPYSVSIHAHEVEHDKGHFPLVFETLTFAHFCNRAAMNHLLSGLDQSAREKSHLVYHGVDVSQFAMRPMPDAVPPLKIVSAGRFTKTKGFARLIRACAELRRQGREVELTILGSGEMMQELQTLAGQIDFYSYLSLPGWVPHAKVSSYLEQAHVFALLADTNFHDGLPNVVLESMAMGRLVILSPLPAAEEVISFGVNGYILKAPDDVEGFVQAVNAMLDQPAIIETMGKEAARVVREEFDAKQHILQLAALFNRYAQA